MFYTSFFMESLEFYIIENVPLLILFFLFFPFFGSITLGVFGRFFGMVGSVVISIVIMIFLCLCVFLFLFLVLGGSVHEIFFGEWIPVGLGFDWIFILDILNVEMCFIIVLISFCVIVYSVEYMKFDPHFVRFFSYLLLFTFFMLFFVLSGNLLQMFIGWEGVGLVSYLLVNFWFLRLEANRSAVKAILFNKVGDLGYVLALVYCVFFFKTTDFSVIFSCFNDVALFIEDSFFFFSLEFFCFCLFLGAMSKSAQFGLHAWLPDAMEGPTPVSSLLHSATMVTAGIFLMLRFSPIFGHCHYVLYFIAFIGSLTSLVAGTVALFQYDLKKIIAYSTCSQLGFMVAAFGLNNVNGCFFHLINHAFFKALLFLTAGSIIHSLFDEQDIRKMGGLFYFLPYTGVAMFIGFLGLVGFPFLTGFYSKEHILTFSLYGKNIYFFLFFYYYYFQVFVLCIIHVVFCF